jgi:8-oxo-dGTP pyrophosphatase MutT (NUDIX family)
MVDDWKLTKTKKILHTAPFSIWQKTYLKPYEEANFDAFVIQTPDWANIVAITPEGKILLVRQFRFGTDRVELEIPGGVVEPDEPPLQAAQRELREETGYKSTSWRQIGVVDQNPAIQTNRCYTFLATDVVPTGTGTHFDPDEIIDLEFASLKEIREYIRSGHITNTYIIAAFHWLALDSELL